MEFPRKPAQIAWLKRRAPVFLICTWNGTSWKVALHGTSDLQIYTTSRYWVYEMTSLHMFRPVNDFGESDVKKQVIGSNFASL